MKELVQSHDIMPVIKSLLNDGHQVKIKITGNSMWPFYKNRRTVVTLEEPKHIRKYDVLLYEFEGQYKLHRLIKKKDVLWIRGDNNLCYEYIPYNQVFGIVIKHNNSNKLIHHRSTLYLINVWLWQMLKPFRRIIKKIRGI